MYTLLGFRGQYSVLLEKFCRGVANTSLVCQRATTQTEHNAPELDLVIWNASASQATSPDCVRMLVVCLFVMKLPPGRSLPAQCEGQSMAKHETKAGPR